MPEEQGFEALVREVDGDSAVLETAIDYRGSKHTVWGINARNREQNFALNLLMDPEVDFVSLVGTAGTGKTLLALAAGLTQTLEDNRYKEIIMTRVTVPVGEDIGFLPGHGRRKNDALDGRADGQPRGTDPILMSVVTGAVPQPMTCSATASRSVP